MTGDRRVAVMCSARRAEIEAAAARLAAAGIGAAIEPGRSCGAGADGGGEPDDFGLVVDFEDAYRARAELLDFEGGRRAHPETWSRKPPRAVRWRWVFKLYAAIALGVIIAGVIRLVWGR